MSTQAKPLHESPALAKPFSYAQAARGASNTPSAQSSKPASGAITPAKEQSIIPGLKSELNNAKWGDAVEDEVKDHSSTSTAVDAQSTSSMKSPSVHPVSHLNGVASPASTDFVASSTSTLARDEAASPLPDVQDANWETKSQASVAAKPQKSQNSADRASSRGRKRGSRKSEKKDKPDAEASQNKSTWTEPPVPLTEAPPPSVNIWQLRIQQKSTTVVKPAPKSNQGPSADSTTSVSHEEQKMNASSSAEVKKPTDATALEKKPVEGESGKKVEEKSSGRKEPRSVAKAAEKVAKVSSPMVDQESWPTPETAQEEEHKKKPQETREGESSTANTPKSKSAWEKMEFTPSVVFNTPLPNSGSRRGGRGGGRGGREGQSRTGNGEKRGDSVPSNQAGENSRRGDAARSGSRDQSKREDAAPRRQSRQENSTRETSVKPAGQDDKTRPADVGEQNATSTTRPANAPRPKGNRRQEAPPPDEEKRREEALGKENGSFATVKEPEAGVHPESHPNVNPSTTEERKPETSPESSERKTSAVAETSIKSQDRRSNGSFAPYPSSRERTETRGRGGLRGGRNGSHGFNPVNHAFGNGQSSNYTPQAYNSNHPRSPTGFGQEPFFGHTAQPQRYGRGFASRPASIPNDSSYSRVQNGFTGSNLQINTGVQNNGMYPADYYMPATAIPYGQDSASSLVQSVSVQMEYYFSVDNLIKDMFLRKHMDSQGFVFLTFIANFKRLKSMTMDLEMIKYVCQQSPNIEHLVGSDGVDRLRVANGWDKWVLPVADRDPTAQNDGPDSFVQPPRPHPQVFDMHNPMRHTSLPLPNSAGPVLVGGGQGFQSLNGFASSYSFGPSGSTDMSNLPQNPTSPTNMSNEQVPLPAFPPIPPMYANGIVDDETDTFTDAEVEGLRIVYRNPTMAESGGSPHPAPTRSFSNGSLDGQSLANGLNGLRIANDPPISNSSATPSDSESRESSTSSERASNLVNGPNRMPGSREPPRGSLGQDASSNFPGVFWTRDKDSPSTETPPAETTTDLYYPMRERALQQRNFHPCPHDMTVMYNFWSHFLVRNFNTRMYMEFRLFAMEDANSRHSDIGMNSLLKYYGGALAHDGPIRKMVAADYVTLVQNESRDSGRPAFKQLRSAWRDGALNMKNRKRIKDYIDPPMEAELDCP